MASSFASPAHAVHRDSAFSRLLVAEFSCVNTQWMGARFGFSTAKRHTTNNNKNAVHLRRRLKHRQSHCLSHSHTRTTTETYQTWKKDRRKKNKHGGDCRKILRMCKNVTGNIRTNYTFFFIFSILTISRRDTINVKWTAENPLSFSICLSHCICHDEWMSVFFDEMNAHKLNIIRFRRFELFWWCVHCAATRRKSPQKMVFGHFDMYENVCDQSNFCTFRLSSTTIFFDNILK